MVYYRVVVNFEGQYSIWPAEQQNPPGWRDGGKTDTREACLDFIEEVWLDMRPRSLRRPVARQVRERWGSG
ncbi:MAG: MbtH family NRPS accessory protein [Chloroflexaceae bacterium]|nr:MbtH family NRPS accessory protein [Chloroflexaceae bacterium]NJL32602.1 MbtH family NRPS accessory protein [Chloroflexaceae bacterium]